MFFVQRARRILRLASHPFPPLPSPIYTATGQSTWHFVRGNTRRTSGPLSRPIDGTIAQLHTQQHFTSRLASPLASPPSATRCNYHETLRVEFSPPTRTIALGQSTLCCRQKATGRPAPIPVLLVRSPPSFAWARQLGLHKHLSLDDREVMHTQYANPYQTKRPAACGNPTSGSWAAVGVSGELVWRRRWAAASELVWPTPPRQIHRVRELV